MSKKISESLYLILLCEKNNQQLLKFQAKKMLRENEFTEQNLFTKIIRLLLQNLLSHLHLYANQCLQCRYQLF